MQPKVAVLARAERLERVAEVVLGRGPLQRDALARPDLQGGAIGGDRLFQPLGAVLARDEVWSAVPRLFWVMAQSSGTRSRVLTPRAAR